MKLYVIECSHEFVMMDYCNDISKYLSCQILSLKACESQHSYPVPLSVFGGIDLIPQQQILHRTIYIIYNVTVLSDLVESSGYSSKTLQKGSCPYAPLDEALW